MTSLMLLHDVIMTSYCCQRYAECLVTTLFQQDSAPAQRATHTCNSWTAASRNAKLPSMIQVQLATVKELLKSDSICWSYAQIKKDPVFWLTVYLGLSQLFHTHTHTHTHIVFLSVQCYAITLYVNSPTGQTRQRIFTVDSLKYADLRKDVPFGVSMMNNHI